MVEKVLTKATITIGIVLLICIFSWDIISVTYLYTYVRESERIREHEYRVGADYWC